MSLQATGSVLCQSISCGGGAASYLFGPVGPSNFLAIHAVDDKGNVLPGLEITSNSGFKYPTKFGSKTTLATSMNPSMLGQSVTFTASVSSFGRTDIPTGIVKFKDAKTVMGSATLSNGIATFTTSSLSSGTHSITATYGGDPGSSGSQSAVIQQVVN